MAKQFAIPITGAVETHFQKQIPETVWHYTGAQGFVGIVQSRAVWATHARHLNDTEEIFHSRRFAEEFLNSKQVGQSHPTTRILIKDLVTRAFDSGILSEKRIEVFLASFSEAENDLNQFRVYAEDCKGASLGFDASRVRPPQGTDKAVRFAPCIYDDAEKKFMVEEALGDFVARSNSLIANVEDLEWVDREVVKHRQIARIYGDVEVTRPLDLAHDVVQIELKKLITRFTVDLFSIATIFKHHAFRDEREWRLVLAVDTASPQTSKVRKLRRSGDREIPYVEITREVTNLRLTRALLGPCWSDVATAERQLADANSKILLDKSTIPYRCNPR